MSFQPRSRSRYRWAGLVLLAFIALLTGTLSCASSPSESGTAGGNLLAGLSPSDASGISNQGRITDGVKAKEGDDWQTNVTSVVRPHGQLTYDLGKTAPIVAAILQGDANDTYMVDSSDDGKTFKRLWTARPQQGGGMRTREASNLSGQARFIRVTASGGDGRYSIGELALFSERPNPFPPNMTSLEGESSRDIAKNRMHLFALASIVFLLFNRRKAPVWVKGLVAVPIGFGIYLGVQLYGMWPLDEPELTLLRAIIAAIGMVVVFRHYFPGRESQQDARWTNTALAVLAVLAIGCYYHFGMPQFRDEAKGRQTLVHPWDMRVYFPLVKYFNELRFDGLYLASVAAYIDNNPHVTEDTVRNVRLRDLTNNEVKVAGDCMPQIHDVRKRFSPERWAEFRKDMKYFQDVMGPGGYLGSLRDHGGNATPVWILGAYPFWAWSPASEVTLSLTALLDPLLLIAMLVAIGRTFGWRAALICAIVFGTTDLSRFGTNLMGSTLRLDWMVAVGFGACALYKRKWMAGGALLAYAGLIRGFPALATIFLVAPPAMWLVDWFRSKDRPPLWPTFRKEQEPFLKAAAGAVGCVVILFALSSAVFGYQAAWGNWLYKISIHQNKPNVNHVGLRNVLSYESHRTSSQVLRPALFEPWEDWQKYQLAAFDRRKPLYYGGILLFTGLVFLASRRRNLHQSAVMGLMMIPIYFYPANYYCHYVFLLPLAAVDRRDTDKRLFGWVAIVLLAMSVALFPTLTERRVDVLYTLQSDVILAGFFLVLVPLAYFAWRGWKVPALAAAPSVPLDQEPQPEPETTPLGSASEPQVEAAPKKRKKKRKPQQESPEQAEPATPADEE